MKIKVSKGERCFEICNILLMLALCFSVVYPLLYIFTLSVSSADASHAAYRLLPEQVDFANYLKVLKNPDIVLGFKNTILRTVVGSFVTVILSILTAYPLAKKHFPLRNFWTGFIIFTMFFGGGLVPTYLAIKSYHLLNSFWVLILPCAINTYNMIIMRNFFMALPETIEEAAKIDGANDFTILFSVVLPMSTAIIATVTLWSMVSHWNAWFDAMIYTTKPDLQVLQNIMRRIIVEGTAEMMNPNTVENYTSALNPENIKAATIMVTTIPIICVYPFLQKYFVKGVLVGSLKG